MHSIRHTWLIATLGVALLASRGLWSEAARAFAEADRISKAEFETLQHDLERLKAELEGLKNQLERMGPRLAQHSDLPTRLPDTVAQVRVTGHAILGSPDAPVTLIEFTDYQCPYCAQFAQRTLPAFKAEYIDTGKVRYVVRDFPLDRMHPQARKAAEAARCAGDQGHYWAMHDLLFHTPKALDTEQLKAYARHLNLDPTAFETCLDQGHYTAEVQQDYEDGVAAGVRGTPGFFLGKTRPDRSIQGSLMRGLQPLTAFRQAIDRLLREQE